MESGDPELLGREVPRSVTSEGFSQKALPPDDRTLEATKSEKIREGKIAQQTRDNRAEEINSKFTHRVKKDSKKVLGSDAS